MMKTHLVSHFVKLFTINQILFSGSSQTKVKHLFARFIVFREVKKVKYLILKGTSGTHAKTRTSFKILTAIWLLSIVVLINAYSGVLTSLLTVTKLKPIAHTMKDVAESKELRVTCETSSIYCKMFLVFHFSIILFILIFIYIFSDSK